MSNANVQGPGIDPSPGSGRLLSRLLLANAPYIVLYGIAVVLIAMTDHNPATAKPSWNYFIPLVGLVSTLSGWRQNAGQDWGSRSRYLLRQVLHWGSLLLVVWLLFRQDVQYVLTAESDGFVLIYLLGLASILGGIYLDWKLALFGLFLIVSGVIIAFLTDNALLIAVGSVAVMGIIVGAFAWIRFHQAAE
jgi:hypothetical protein